jgi:hypothetical protein
LGDRRFQCPFVPQTVKPAELIDLVTVDLINLFACQENGLLFQRIQPGSRCCARRLFSQAAKQAGMLGAGFAVRLIELLLRSGTNARGFPVGWRLATLRLSGLRWRGLPLFALSLIHGTLHTV